MSLWGKITGLVAGGAVAGAAAASVEPTLEGLRQDAWKANQVRTLDAATIGALLAQRLIDGGAADEQLAREGLGGDKAAYLHKLNETAPDISLVLELVRRKYVGKAEFDTAFNKSGLREEYRDPLWNLRHNPLTPADLANAVQQGFVPGAGLLPGLVGGESGISIPVDEVNIDTLAEFEDAGIDNNHAKVLAELVGLPPGPIELLQMLNRGIITDESYYVGIREGHTKTKWANALKALRHAILTPIEAANLHLRQWISKQEMYDIGAQSGMSQANMDLLYDMQGRPPGPSQLQTAYNRGLIDRARFDKGIAESDVRTEWTDVEFGLRARYPTPFALRQLVSSGALTAADGEEILKLEGYPPDLARKMATAWAAGKTAKQKELAQGTIETLYEARYIDGNQATLLLTKLGYDAAEITLILELGDARRVKRFLDAAIGRIHTKYVSHILPRQTALLELQALNLSAQAVADIMAEWDLERDVNKPVLTPAQVVAAHHYNVIQRDTALTMLVQRGYSQTDAEILVDTRAHGTPSGQPLE